MFEKLSWQLRLNRVISMLEQDRKLLLQGRSERLADHALRRADMEAELRSIPERMAEAHQAEISRIKTLAKRNELLLSAYIDGARKAVHRLAEIEANQSSIGAYGSDGARLDPAAKRRTKDRKA
ncbi:MAG: hypothetical protein AAFR17_17535 [Pseudomonadota bacterium]